MLDQIGNAHMTQGENTTFTLDRFGNANSALALNGGWTQVPSGVYFETVEFTISVWILPQQVGYAARIIDFGNDQSDNIFLALSCATKFHPYFQILSGPSPVITSASCGHESLISLQNNWQSFVATFDGKRAIFYLNGQVINEVNKNYTLPSNSSRNNCFIGKSNWPTDGYSFSFLDDLKFYNKSLTQQEIIELINETSNFSF